MKSALAYASAATRSPPWCTETEMFSATMGHPRPLADVVSCNLSDPGIGVSASQFERLRANHDLVIHCAALTRFDLGTRRLSRHQY